MFKEMFLRLFLFGWIASGFISVADAQSLPQHSHAHDCATAVEIPLNSEVKATLQSTNDYAVYGITLKERGLLEVSTDPVAMDAWGMQLLDSSCQPVPKVVGAISMLTGSWAEIAVPHKDLFSPATNSVWTLQPDVYFVRIRPNPVDVFREQFTFHTKFIPHHGHDCDTAQPMELFHSVAGELLYPDDREVFRVTTTEPGQINAWMIGPRGYANPAVVLRLQDCSSGIDQLVNLEGTAISRTSLAAGVYYVSVEAARPEQLGPFSLHVDFIPERVTEGP